MKTIPTNPKPMTITAESGVLRVPVVRHDPESDEIVRIDPGKGFITGKRSTKRPDEEQTITILGPADEHLTPDEMRKHIANLWREIEETRRQYLIDAVLKRQ